MKLFIEFLEKPWRIKWMVFCAMFFSLYYKAVIKNKEFAAYAEKMGTFRYETPMETLNDPRIKEVKWVAYTLRRWTPWETKCFDRALTAKKLLNRYGLPCTLYMGVRTEGNGEMTAHAWLRCGTEYVSGGSGRGYAITGIYGDKKV